MKILRFSYEWPPPWIGLTPHIYEVTSHQAKKGHFIDVFCARWFKSGNIERLPRTRLHTFFREPLPGTLLITVGPLVLFYYWMYRLSTRPDVIHMHGHFGYWVLLYRQFLSFFKKKNFETTIPLVAHFHNNAQQRWDKMKESEQKLNWYSEKISYPLEVKANKLAIKLADAYIFVSEDMKKAAIELYNADPNKCHVVESGVNTDLFSPVDMNERDKTRKELGLIFTDKVIVNVGFIKERKNIHLLVESLTKLPPEYKLILMGEGSEAYTDKIDEFVRDHNLSHRVIRIGASPYKEVPFVMQVADIFVLPSSYEGLSKAALESLSCGVPVLYSGSTFSQEISGLFYLKEISPDEIAANIKRITESKPFVDTGKIKSLYSWSRKVDEIEKVYESIKKPISN